MINTYRISMRATRRLVTKKIRHGFYQVTITTLKEKQYMSFNHEVGGKQYSTIYAD